MRNKNKYTFISSLLLTISTIANGQSFLNNDSVSFKVLRQSQIIKNEKEIIPVMYFIKVNLSTQEREVCKKIEKTEWLKMLSNDKMDWVTNLILYDLYGKNAISYCGEIKTRNEWLIIKKKKDVEYWKKILTAN